MKIQIRYYFYYFTRFSFKYCWGIVYVGKFYKIVLPIKFFLRCLFCLSNENEKQQEVTEFKKLQIIKVTLQFLLGKKLYPKPSYLAENISIIYQIISNQLEEWVL